MKRLAIAMAIGSFMACSGGSSTAPTSPADIAGSYNVNITASSSCSANLPSDTRALLFVSTVTQTGAAVQMQLIGHQGGTATVSGTVSGQTVNFPSWSLSETMGRGATLAASGSATVASPNRLTGTLNGTFQTPAGSSCNAANHQLEMVKLCSQPTPNGTALVPCP
jgi:type 1 fimbria pilin